MPLYGRDLQCLLLSILLNFDNNLILCFLKVFPFLFSTVYQPPLAITVHRLVSQIQKPNLEWPKSYQRYS